MLCTVSLADQTLDGKSPMLVQPSGYEAQVRLRLRCALSHTGPVSRTRRAVKPRTKFPDYARSFASRGGKARAKALTAKERTAIGIKGAEARWAKSKRRPSS